MIQPLGKKLEEEETYPLLAEYYTKESVDEKMLEADCTAVGIPTGLIPQLEQLMQQGTCSNIACKAHLAEDGLVDDNVRNGKASNPDPCLIMPAQATCPWLSGGASLASGRPLKGNSAILKTVPHLN